MAVRKTAASPVIGITAYHVPASWGPWRTINTSLVPEDYIDGVIRSGGIPLVIPAAASVSTSVEQILDRIDALILTGGGDIDPSRYGEQPHPTTDPPNPLRDEAEFRLLAAARARAMPTLAVCRGAQILNILCGGTLRQHLADADATALTTHRARLGVFSRHPVHVAAGRLQTLVGGKLVVSSHHHQGFGQVASALRPIAFAPDGVTEALEDTEALFCLGVLWHPEQALDNGGLPLFAGLVEAARQARQLTTARIENTT